MVRKPMVFTLTVEVTDEDVREAVSAYNEGRDREERVRIADVREELTEDAFRAWLADGGADDADDPQAFVRWAAENMG